MPLESPGPAVQFSANVQVRESVHIERGRFVGSDDVFQEDGQSDHRRTTGRTA